MAEENKTPPNVFPSAQLRLYTDGTPHNTHVFLPDGTELAVNQVETNVTSRSAAEIVLRVYVKPLSAMEAATLIANNKKP